MSTTTLKKLRVDEIHPSPHNLRTDVGDVSDLAASIAGVGLLEPMRVRKNDDGYELIAGERRWSAIKQLVADPNHPDIDSLTTWDCVVATRVSDDVQTASMIVENLHRAGLTPLEEFRGLARLAAEHSWTADEISSATGIALATVKQRLKWMVLTDEQLTTLFERGLRLDLVDDVAKCDQAEIDEIFSGSIDGYRLEQKINQVTRLRSQTRKRTKIRNRLRRAGHLVVGSGAGDEKDVDAAVKVLQEMKAEAAKIEDAKVTERAVSQYDLDDAEWLDAQALPVPSVFFMEKDEYRIPVKLMVIDRPLTDDERAAKEANQSDYKRAMRVATEAFDQARAEYAEAEREARRQFLEEKPAKLVSAALKHVLMSAQESVIKDACRLLGIVQSKETLVAYAGQSAADLARAAVAVQLFGYGRMPVPGFTLTPPEAAWPVRAHYDETGAYIGEPDAEADEG